MPKLILICGKICAGKTTYAKRLMDGIQAIRLSGDEIMLALFPEPLGDRYEIVLDGVLDYLYNKAAEIISSGINVIMDCGFWQRHYRDEANAFFRERAITPEWHYVSVSDETWRKNIELRNGNILSGGTGDYYVDENLLAKFLNKDDEPLPDEIDVLYENDWI